MRRGEHLDNDGATPACDSARVVLEKLEGDISESLFALLCDLDRFDLRGNSGINQKTLAGHLACTLTNLKDQLSIDASNKGLTGSPSRVIFKILCVEAVPTQNSASLSTMLNFLVTT